jgi:ADP-heptose:LPS heptosyltransferase
LQLDPADREHVLSCGEFSLAELRALVDRSALFIGGDSGPLHVAATSTVPIVGLYGPTLPVRSAPWRDAQWITGRWKSMVSSADRAISERARPATSGALPGCDLTGDRGR